MRLPKSAKELIEAQTSLFNAIHNGEGKKNEFEEDLPSNQVIAKTVIAFSGTAGGKLIIGFNDRGVVTELKADVDILNLQDKFASVIHDNCYPNVLLNIYTTTVAGKVLLVIEIYGGNTASILFKKTRKK